VGVGRARDSSRGGENTAQAADLWLLLLGLELAGDTDANRIVPVSAIGEAASDSEGVARIQAVADRSA